MKEDFVKWLMDVVVRTLAPRLFAGAVLFVAGILLDAGLLGGELVDGLRALLVP